MGVRIHKKYGLNPTMTTCFYCGESKDILLVGSATTEFKKVGLSDYDGRMNPNIGVIDKEPCSKCAKYMEQGIICISVKDDSVGSDNPFRTGGWAVVKDSAFDTFLDRDILLNIKKSRVVFIPDTVWDNMGLPRK